jgi:transposase
MSYLRGPDRSQVQLLPPCLDDYVRAESAVRFIEAWAESLDFKTLGFTAAEPASTGRPPYHPADLTKLYLYGYLYRIRSSRRLEAEAGRNLELMWLLRGLCPDFKTIADFRKNNAGVLKGLFKEFNLLCRKLGLFGAELVAIDGSKFKAVNNLRRHYTQEQLKELLQQIDRRVEEYLRELEQQDTEAEGAGGTSTRQQLQDKISQLQGRRQSYQELVSEMEEAGQKEVSLTDPDSRGMKKVGIGYNVQAAVDAKHHLIIEQEVVQAACDRNQLAAMAAAAKAELQVEQLKVVADAGYHEADQLEQCEQAGIETFVPDTGKSSGQSRNGKEVFPKEDFVYDPQVDQYRCPAGQMLKAGHVSACKGKDRVIYYNRSACRGCPLKEQCTTASYRAIYRRTNEAVLDRQATRLAEHPEIMKQRKAIVEHPFGTLRNWGHDHFLMRGLRNIRAEFSVSALAYNLRRVLNLFSVSELIQKVSSMRAELG